MIKINHFRYTIENLLFRIINDDDYLGTLIKQDYRHIKTLIVNDRTIDIHDEYFNILIQFREDSETYKLMDIIKNIHNGGGFYNEEELNILSNVTKCLSLNDLSYELIIHVEPRNI
jgi:hypothetical protein